MTSAITYPAITNQRGKTAVRMAKEDQNSGPVVIHVNTDPLIYAPDSHAWWDVPVSQVADLASTRDAYGRYLEHQADQRHFLAPATPAANPPDARLS